MPKSWSKGYTKYTHPSVLKRSRTMKRLRVDNFAHWRQDMKNRGLIRSDYPPLERTGDLAELIGVVLGDGYIMKYPRTEELSIFSNSKNTGFVSRYGKLIEKVFDQKPAITKHGKTNCTRIRIYQKHIQSRLGVPFSPRKLLKVRIPRWILNDKGFVVRYLRGLYEAEGSHCIHKPTSTYKMFFTNRNTSMLNNVYKLVKMLGFHPHMSLHQVQISRKKEVFAFIDLIRFRKY